MKILTAIILFFTTININAMNSQEPTLYYLLREPKIKSDKPPVIFLLHGVGSNEKDLFSFADQLPDHFLVISLRAPHQIGHDSYAWYQVNFSSGKPVSNKEQAEQSRLLILSFIEEIKTKVKFDDKQIYLCGFSQGAIMSYSVGLTNPDKIKGIAILSGRILDEIKPIVAPNEKLKALKVFIAHGINDQVLSVNYAREAYAYLKQRGINSTYKEYNEGHSVSAATLKDMIDWLK